MQPSQPLIIIAKGTLTFFIYFTSSYSRLIKTAFYLIVLSIIKSLFTTQTSLTIEKTTYVSYLPLYSVANLNSLDKIALIFELAY